MKFSDVIGMAFKDLGKRKGRTFLTSLAVAIGSMLVLTMVGIGVTAEKMVLDQLKEFNNVKQVTTISQKYQDPNSDKEEINSETDYEEMLERNFKKIDKETLKKINNIEGVGNIEATIQLPIFSAKVLDKEIKRGSVVGYDLNYEIFSKDRIEAVREKKKDKSINPIYVGKNLNSSSKNEVIVGQSYLKEMGITDYKSVIDKDIVLSVSKSSAGNNLKPMELKGKIIGVIDDRFENEAKQIFVPLDMAATLKGYVTFNKNYVEDKGYDNVSIYAKSADDVSNIGKEIKNMGYQYFSYEQIADQIKEFFSIGKSILAALGVIVLFVAAVGIVNTMTMSIHERTKNIGIMKSLGASRENIHSIFLAEAGAIGFIGGIMGLIFSVMNGKIIELGLRAYMQGHGAKDAVVNFTMPSWLIFGTLGFAVLMALLSGIYPSRKASKLNPVEALNS